MIKNRMHTEPIPVVRQHRPVRLRQITTMPVGKAVPIASFGLLRGDSCSGRVNIALEMNETFEILFNRTHARLSAWFFPSCAAERFQRNKTFFERSAAGEPSTDEEGAEVIPFIETHNYVAGQQLYKHLGLSAVAGTPVSTEYREAYNQIINYVWRQRSKSLATEELKRPLNRTILSPAMWGDSVFSHIVPDFDAGMIAGALPLTLAGGQIPVSAVVGASGDLATQGKFRRTNGTAIGAGDVVTASNGDISVATNPAFYDPMDTLYATLATDGAQIMLANIDQARKLVDWAKAREKYEGHEEPWIIDTLMSGIAIDDQAWFHPMLLDQKMVDVRQIKRMATDYANMEEGVANGVAVTSLGINVPPNMFGGTVMIIAEAFPEQLYERQADPYWTTTDPDDLPRYDRDVLNPMPVVEVLNKQVDMAHTSPNERFGYAERNWQWANWPTRVGGDLYAPNADAATDVARRSIWATDVENPTLSKEFYLTTTLGTEVFVDQTVNPIKVGIGGTLDVMGLTIIGEVHESEANYDAVRAEYPPLVVPTE